LIHEKHEKHKTFKGMSGFRLPPGWKAKSTQHTDLFRGFRVVRGRNDFSWIKENGAIVVTAQASGKSFETV
jgi:hypothetical protein